MVALGESRTMVEKVIGFVGVFLATMNAAGGYAVTVRMLEMFEKKKRKGK